jgi:hypothetical protein
MTTVVPSATDRPTHARPALLTFLGGVETVTGSSFSSRATTRASSSTADLPGPRQRASAPLARSYAEDPHGLAAEHVEVAADEGPGRFQPGLPVHGTAEDERAVRVGVVHGFHALASAVSPALLKVSAKCWVISRVEPWAVAYPTRCP